MEYPDGRTYAGSFKDSKRDGWGTCSWTDGRYYEGGWRLGQLHGEGLYKSSKGTSRAGYWIDGKRIKWTTEAETA